MLKGEVGPPRGAVRAAAAATDDDDDGPWELNAGAAGFDEAWGTVKVKRVNRSEGGRCCGILGHDPRGVSEWEVREWNGGNKGAVRIGRR